jgi:HEPN domain-containing protein
LYLKINAPATNLALSVELSLKSILLYRNSEIPLTHKLSSLYNSISKADRDVIEDVFSRLSVNESLFPNFLYIKAEVDGKYTKSQDDEKVFNEIIHNLELHDRSFIDWRYIFEFSINNEEALSFNFSFMVRLSRALFEYSATIIQ